MFSSTGVSPISGLTVIAYTRLISSSGQSELRLLRCEQPDCSSYNVQVLASGVSQGYRPSLAFQTSGFPMVSCSQAHVNVSLFSCLDAGCTTFTTNLILPPTASSPGWTSVALIDNVPSVAFAANSGATSSAVYFWQSGKQATQILFEDPTQSNRIQWGSDRAMAFTTLNNGNTMTAFYVDGTGLILVLCATYSCNGIKSTPVVDAASFSTDVGLYASIVAHPKTGFAVVAYHDATNLQLKMVLCQDRFCTTNRIVRSFPSTVGWDPSVLIDSVTGFPAVAYSNPAISNLVLMSCGWTDCSNATFSPLLPINSAPTSPRRFESIKLISTRPVVRVVAHETVAASLILVGPADGGNLQCANGTVNCTSIVNVIITSPTSSPSSTLQPVALVQGFITPFSGENLLVVVNNNTNLSFNRTSGQFAGSVALATGTNILTVVAVNVVTQQPVGAASVIILFVSTGPSINITAPASNNTATVAATIIMQGFASAVSGVASVVLLNKATGVQLQSNATSPQWIAQVDLAIGLPNTFLVTATDNLGQTVSQSITILQLGLLPQVTCPGDFSIECGTVIPSPALRVLNCAETAVLSETAQSTCGGARSITRIASACGVSCSYKILLVDTIAPILSCPPNQAVPCSALSALSSPIVSDACALSAVLVSVAVQPSLQCGTNLTRVFTASDGCGNSASCSQTVSVSPPTTLPSGTFPAPETTAASGALSDGAVGGLVVGLVLLMLILLLAFLVALCWLRKKKRENSAISSAPIMMADFDDEMSVSSVSSVSSSKLYRPPPNQSDDSVDMAEVMRN